MVVKFPAGIFDVDSTSNLVEVLTSKSVEKRKNISTLDVDISTVFLFGFEKNVEKR